MSGETTLVLLVHSSYLTLSSSHNVFLLLWCREVWHAIWWHCAASSVHLHVATLSFWGTPLVACRTLHDFSQILTPWYACPAWFCSLWSVLFSCITSFLQQLYPVVLQHLVLLFYSLQLFAYLQLRNTLSYLLTYKQVVMALAECYRRWLECHTCDQEVVGLIAGHSISCSNACVSLTKQ